MILNIRVSDPKGCTWLWFENMLKDGRRRLTEKFKQSILSKSQLTSQVFKSNWCAISICERNLLRLKCAWLWFLQMPSFLHLRSLFLKMAQTFVAMTSMDDGRNTHIRRRRKLWKIWFAYATIWRIFLSSLRAPSNRSSLLFFMAILKKDSNHFIEIKRKKKTTTTLNQMKLLFLSTNLRCRENMCEKETDYWSHKNLHI